MFVQHQRDEEERLQLKQQHGEPVRLQGTPGIRRWGSNCCSVSRWGVGRGAARATATRAPIPARPLVTKLRFVTHWPPKLRFVYPPPMHNRYTVREIGAAHFVTSTIVEWLPVFTTA